MPDGEGGFLSDAIGPFSNTATLDATEIDMLQSPTHTFGIGAGAIADGEGGLRWTKVDQDGAPLAGATFEVLNEAGVVVVTVVDNGEHDADPADGAFLVQGLNGETYVVRESEAPAGYLKTEETRTGTPTARTPVPTLDAFVNQPVP
ncbi:MAG: hypothetical protein GXX86_03530, partial [Propionibacterium sp.]|nr:hypothetical protein [Propionibacterium sp.]